MKTSQIKKGDIVTADFGNSKASNTFIFEGLYGEGDQKTVALLKHPLAPKIIFPYKTEELNQDSVRIKDSTERSLDYVLRHQTRLDYNALSDLEALCLYFAVTRKMTPKQKNILSGLRGTLASLHFDNNINDAMDFIQENDILLDDFNLMWYNNFSGLFKGNQSITSKKQRSAIFNIAGFLLAEVESPVTHR